jgi:uncharacterized protein (DUF2141 family)
MNFIKNSKSDMKLSFIPIFLFLILYGISGFPQSTQEGTIIIEITGIETEGGIMMVGLFKDTDKFLKIPSYNKDPKITDESNITVKLENIPYGTYAVSIYHDLNENGELDSKFMGIPKEPVGFSNNYFPKFGPPKFKNASFDLNQKELKIAVNLRTY